MCSLYITGCLPSGILKLPQAVGISGKNTNIFAFEITINTVQYLYSSQQC